MEHLQKNSKKNYDIVSSNQTPYAESWSIILFEVNTDFLKNTSTLTLSWRRPLSYRNQSTDLNKGFREQQGSKKPLIL